MAGYEGQITDYQAKGTLWLVGIALLILGALYVGAKLTESKQGRNTAPEGSLENPYLYVNGWQGAGEYYTPFSYPEAVFYQNEEIFNASIEAHGDPVPTSP